VVNILSWLSVVIYLGIKKVNLSKKG